MGDENSNYADFHFNGAKLGIFERKQMMKAIGEKYVPVNETVDKVALIFKVDNVERTYEALKNKVVFITEPTEQKDWGIKVAHFRDPAGNLIEIYENIM